MHILKGKAILIFFPALFFLLAWNISSAKENTSNDNEIFAFAENLYSQNDYYRAITEYKRLVFFFPQSSFADQAKFKIAKSYQLGEKFDLAGELFDGLAVQYKDKDLGLRAEFESIETSYRLGNWEGALASFKRLILDEKFKSYRGASIYRIGYSELHLKETKKAREAFQSITEPPSIVPIAQEMALKTDEFEKLPRKSPLLAGILSTIIPGTGQFYNGRIKDGIVALITNGLFTWGIYEAYSRKFYTVGAVSSVFGFGWYAGTIYGAVNGAHKYNFSKENEFFESLKTRYEFFKDPIY